MGDMGVGETPSGSRQSFFVHNFNRADWLTIVFGVVGFAGLMWLLFEAILSAQLAEVKTEIALVRDAVEDAEASLTSASLDTQIRDPGHRSERAGAAQR